MLQHDENAVLQQDATAYSEDRILNVQENDDGSINSDVTTRHNDIQEVLMSSTYVITDEDHHSPILLEPEIASGSYHGA